MKQQAEVAIIRERNNVYHSSRELPSEAKAEVIQILNSNI